MALTPQDLEQAYQYIIQKGISIQGLEDGGTDLARMYLAPVIRYNSGGTSATLVRLAVSLLKGADGKPIEINQTETEWQWRIVGDEEWKTLIVKTELQEPAIDAANEVRQTMLEISNKWNEQSEQVSDAVDNANDTANHPTIVGEDNYVYLWDKNTNSYNKTAIFVKGDAFTTKETYSSIAEMEADINNPKIKESDYVLINTNDVEDPDNAKIYIKVKNPDNSYSYRFFVDMSGAIGFTGKTPQFFAGTISTGTPGSEVSVSLSNDGTDPDGNPKYLLNITIPRGNQGPSFNVLESFLTYDALKAKYPDGSGLDGVMIVGKGTIENPYDYYSWGYLNTTGIDDWINLGSLMGPEGKSAYQLAVEGGFNGTVSEWLESLKGKSIYQIWLDQGNEGSVSDFLSEMRGQDWRVMDIDHIPGENDLTYEEDGMTKTFPIGAELRYFDTEREEYVFYKLYDLNQFGLAVWKLLGSGGGSGGDGTAIMKVRVMSNQAQPDQDLQKAVLMLYFDDSLQGHESWKGEEITFRIPANKVYKIIPGDVEGYKTPEEITFTAVQGDVKYYTFYYNTSILRLTLENNQNKSINTTITVKYSDFSFEIAYNDTPINVKIPTTTDIQIIPSDIVNFKTPEVIYINTDLAQETRQMTYLAEKLAVNVEAENGIDVSSQIITIKDNLENILYEGIVEDFTDVLIPYDVEYSVIASPMEGMIKPLSQTFIADQISRMITMVYKTLSFGIFIIDSDGVLTLRADWNTSNNGKAAGVAILSSNCQFIIAKSDSAFAWSVNNNVINGIVTSTDATTAKKDYDGAGNTVKIIAQLGAENAPAANYCKSISFPEGRYGHLPSLGEWQEAYNNKAEVDACMTLIGGTAINKDKYYWSSTQHSERYSWIMGWDSALTGNNSKNTSNPVRAFSKI